MRKSRFSNAQIVALLPQQQAGQTVAQITRQHAISEVTLYQWKTKYGGLALSELTCLNT